MFFFGKSSDERPARKGLNSGSIHNDHKVIMDWLDRVNRGELSTEPSVPAKRNIGSWCRRYAILLTANGRIRSSYCWV